MDSNLFSVILVALATTIVTAGTSAEENFNEDIPIEDAPPLGPVIPQEHSIFPINPDQYLPTPDLAAKYGYPVEVHKITTKDGYILTHHRIRNGRHAPPAPKGGRPVVWLQHGILCSSSDWIMNNQDKALAYRLADQGYDVWMGNARGNTYSREHVSLKVTDKEFWDFSWHEMGYYDVPASIDYVLNVTKKSNIHYIGHSMGTTMFFVCMSLRPEYNEKIRIMSALAPIGFTKHMIGSINVIAPFATEISWVMDKFGSYEFMPNNDLLDFLGRTFCHENSPIQVVCTNMIFLMMGYGVDQFNFTMLPVIMGHLPAGTSVKTPLHYAQQIKSGYFRRYDHGKDDNLILYGTEDPPDYNLTQITAPIALYWGDFDWLGVEPDILKLARRLPNVVRKYRVKFNHLDFLFAIDSPRLLYKTVEKFMKRF